MSYYETGLEGLGSLPASATYAVGQQLVAGYNVQSSATAAQKLQAVRDAMAYGFRGSIVGAGWGGPGAPGGVPAGQIWIKVQIGAAGITGTTMNAVFSNVAANIQSRLPPGSRVTNTFGSTFGSAPSGTSPSAGTSPLATDPVTGLLTSIGLPGTMTTPGTMLYTPPTENFFTQEFGGIPVWALIGGGTLAVGAVAFVLMSKPKPAAAAAVKANRRRRIRRNTKRTTKSTNWRGESAYTCYACGSSDTKRVDRTTRQCKKCGGEYAVRPHQPSGPRRTR